MAINGFRLDSPLFLRTVLHLFVILSPTQSLSVCLLFFLLLPTRPTIYLFSLLPASTLSLPLSHFPPLIHLSDFARTQGDPGQTSCRGNRQSRNILYFFFTERGEAEEHLSAN